MRRVTKENLIVQIDRLYKIRDEQGQLSNNGEYTLQAYKMLLATMDSESVVDEATAEDCPAFVKYDVTEVDDAWAAGWNACRAAMLNQK